MKIKKIITQSLIAAFKKVSSEASPLNAMEHFSPQAGKPRIAALINGVL